MRADITMPELGDFRWLAVGPPGQDDFSIALLAIPGPPVMDDETKKQIEELMAKGFAGVGLPDDRRRPGRHTRSSRAAASSSPRRPPSARTGSTRSSATPPGTRSGLASRRCSETDQGRGSRRISRPALCAAISESACCSVTASVGVPGLARPGRGRQRQQLHAAGGDVGAGRAAEPALPRDHHVDRATLGDGAADREGLRTGHRDLHRAKPRPDARRAAVPWRAGIASCAPSTYDPTGIVAAGARPRASAGRVSAPGGTKLAGTRRTASPACARSVPIGSPAISSDVATTTGRSGP